jgi:hypothetical protein
MSEDLAHLETAHRAQAGLSADERIDWIRQERWIHYPRADQVIVSIGPQIKERDTRYSLVIRRFEAKNTDVKSKNVI